MAEDEIPKTVINRIVKSKLPGNVQIAKSSKDVLAKASRVFILYLTACANDFCMNSNRSILSANDVLMAIEEIEFNAFLPALNETLEIVRKEQSVKKASKKKEDGDTEELQNTEEKEEDVEDNGEGDENE